MAASSGAIRAGRAFVELFADDSALQKGLKAAEKKLAAWGAGLQTIGSRVAGIGVAGIAAAGAALNIFANIGSELSDMSDVTGIGIEALQEFGFAAQQSGANMEQFVGAVGKMSRLLSEAAGGSAQANAALANIGLNVGELASLNPEQQFERIAEGITAIENPTARTAAAMDIFGRSGARLIPMMQSLAEERANARASGDIISASEARAAEQFGDKMSALGTSAKRAVFALGTELLPIAKMVVDWFQTAARATTLWIQENRGLVVGVGIAVAVVAALGIATWALGLGITVISAAVGLVSGLIGVGYTAAMLAAKVVTWLFGAAVAVATGGVSLLPIAIGLVIAALAGVVIWAASALGAFDGLGDAVEGIGSTFKQTFGGITDALSAGDWAGAMQIAWVGIQLVWTRGIGFLAESWREFRDLFIDVGDTAWTALKVGAFAAWNFLKVGWTEIGSFIERVWSNITFAIEGAWNFVLGEFQMAVARLVAMLPEGIRNRLGDLGSIGSVDAARAAAADREGALEQRRIQEFGGRDNANVQVEGRLNEERRRALRELNQEREDFVNEERASLEARIAERRAARDAASAENQNDIAILQTQLDELTRQAGMDAWEAEWQRVYDRQFGGRAPGGGGMEQALRGSTSSAFNAAAIRGFAGGESPEARTARETARMAVLMQQLLDEARNRGVIFG